MVINHLLNGMILQLPNNLYILELQIDPFQLLTLDQRFI